MKTLKDFLNERQLGPMVVKNPDEQEYVDKHVVQKHDDRNGNGDDVFKAANVKKADRKKDRHGYEPGEDEEVYEETNLIESTYKFDVSGEHGKAGVDKLVSHARSKGIKAKVHTYSGPGGGNPVVHLTHKDPKALHSYVNTHMYPVRDIARHKINEEVEQVDELSQDKLMQYRKAASNPKYGKDEKKTVNRLKGYSLAGRKVNPGLAASMGKAPRVAANEEAEQIDELSKETKASYMKKAGAEIDKHWDNSKTDARSAYKYYGRKNTMKKIANEEAEEVQIDELSKKTLGSYIKKSTRSVVDHSVDATNADRQGEYDTADANYKKISNRIKGVNKAADKLSEKIDMDKASMGDVIKDFQDSNAPQFKGKSDKKRRAMAIAAKLTAERGSKGYTKEERLLARLEDISESHKIELTSIFSKLSEENQNVFLKVCESEAGIEQMLDFAIQNRGK